MGPRTAILAAAAAFVALAASAASAVTAPGLRYTTVEQEGFGPVLTNSFGSGFVGIVGSIAGAGGSGPFNFASQTWAQKLNWNANFAIAAAAVTPTTGYRLTIKRITIQRVNRRLRQFCVIATLAKPGADTQILQRRAWALHVVRLSRRPFRTSSPTQWSIPQAVVLRRSDGKLLAKGYTTEPINPYVGPIPPPAPRLCRA